MTTNQRTCRVCGNTDGNIEYVFKEKQFGTGEPFDYFECTGCGCLQPVEIPEDMSRFYPDDYESHRPIPASKFNPFRRFTNRHLLNHLTGSFDPLGMIQSWFLRTPQVIKWLAVSHTRPDSSILDVGCGMGNLLAKFWQAGVQQLHGVDPFIPQDMDYKDNLSIRKVAFEDWKGSYDLVTSNHSFEHVPDPADFMARMRGFLAPRGTLMIRIPLMGKYAWREFGENWAQLDAPRHLFLHTEESMEHIADGAGLEVYETLYDSQPKQIANSIKFQRGIPYETSNKEVFTKQELAEFKKLTKQLNAKGDGDQATFFLRRK